MDMRDISAAAARWLKPGANERLFALRPMVALGLVHVVLAVFLGRATANAGLALLVLVGAVAYILANDKLVSAASVRALVAEAKAIVRATPFGVRLFGNR